MVRNSRVAQIFDEGAVRVEVRRVVRDDVFGALEEGAADAAAENKGMGDVEVDGAPEARRGVSSAVVVEHPGPVGMLGEEVHDAAQGDAAEIFAERAFDVSGRVGVVFVEDAAGPVSALIGRGEETERVDDGAACILGDVGVGQEEEF
eukprot:CAMPEP_0197427668 /NCGR_PEP_ID=MMETSP1170-20131217/39004_1 /TAXON_ID=54406 /ORGANISM="Sarcinochrysis sp, Strain CCMP770" /LENGTH=147 /DNA_ID=CAMNT_0042955375 /DNA_START=33 /DNA_END=476 /DNA_ORIENTATION=+